MKTVCHCCEPGAGRTPIEVTNRPALTAILYRIGSYSSFREAMLERIAAFPELTPLTTRGDDDYSITVIDLWSAVADVLTFYQERYANEAFLRTALFRDDIQRLTSLIGYRLRPGVAARAMVAFTLDAGKQLAIDVGQKVQSVPAAGQLPQTFETLEKVEADARLNRQRIFPVPVAYSPLGASTSITNLDRLQGPAIAASIAPGDTVLLFTSGSSTAQEEKKVAAVITQDDLTAVKWTQPIKTTAATAMKFKRTFRLFGHNHPVQFTEAFLPSPSIPDRVRWRIVTLVAAGYNTSLGTLTLDSSYKDLEVGQQLLVANTAGQKTLVTIQAVRQASVQFNTASDSVTAVDVLPAPPGPVDRRNVTVYELEGPALLTSSVNYAASFSGQTVFLPGVCRTDSVGPAIEIGRTVERGAYKPGAVLYLSEIRKKRRLILIDAKRANITATIEQDPVLVPANPAAGQFCHLSLELSFEGALQLDPASAVMLGNIAEASQGETVSNEVVGNGAASIGFQRLTLRKSPLTYLSAATPEGMASTLTLRVNGVEWAETPQLFGQKSDAQVFEAIPAEDGGTILQFGDGLTGSRLPTGLSNVIATYRVGSGLAGRVPAGSLTTLLARPTGLSAATNPLAAEGGADPQTTDEARANAPRTVRTFGRIVSLDDFADQVTASGEIAKASAVWVYDGLDLAVHLTVAGQEGATFSNQALRDLGESLKTVRDPNHRLRLANYTRVFVTFRAAIAIDPKFDADAVAAAATQAALDFFAFENLGLGRPIALSDLYRLIQDVEGVLFVDINELMFKKPPGLTQAAYILYLAARGAAFLPAFQPKPVQDRLRIFNARSTPSTPGIIRPGELAALENPSTDLTIAIQGTPA